MLQSDETLEDLAELTNEPEPDMVTVVCSGDTYSIPVSKLTYNSQFFARALEVPMVEKKERKVMIKDIEGSIFEKVIKFITEDAFQFDVETEAFEALEAADRLDMEELKEEVCDRIKDNLDNENAKAVLSMAERFSAKHLLKAAFDFMQENNIKLEKEDVVENPNLAMAFMEECRIRLADMKEELAVKDQELDEKDEILEIYRRSGRGFYPQDIYDSFDDEEDWHVYDSFEEDEEEEEDELEEEEEVELAIPLSLLFSEQGDEEEGDNNGDDQSGASEKEERESQECGKGEKQEKTNKSGTREKQEENGMREKLEEKPKETGQSGTREEQAEICQGENQEGQETEARENIN